MSGAVLNSASKTCRMFRVLAPSNVQRSFICTTNIGDKIPINFMKDGTDPVIMEDKEYPDWVHTLTAPLPTKNQLMKMVKEAGGYNGDLSVLGIRNIKRTKRLMGLELVKENNLMASASK